MFVSLRRIVTAVAIVLLALTAADLAAPGFCADEQLASRADFSLTTGGAVHSNHADVDDCFCCARCLDTGTRIPELRAVAAWVDFADPLRSLVTRSSSLDHPPQNA